MLTDMRNRLRANRMKRQTECQSTQKLMYRMCGDTVLFGNQTRGVHSGAQEGNNSQKNETTTQKSSRAAALRTELKTHAVNELSEEIRLTTT